MIDKKIFWWHLLWIIPITWSIGFYNGLPNTVIFDVGENSLLLADTLERIHKLESIQPNATAMICYELKKCKERIIITDWSQMANDDIEFCDTHPWACDNIKEMGHHTVN